MSAAAPVLHTDIPGLERFRTGKVRDIYDFGDALLIVATDRISAFDYVLGSGIPDKGKVLTQLSAFWFEQLRDVVPNHVISTDPADVPGGGAARTPTRLRGRIDAGPHARAAADRMRRARAICRDRAGRTTSRPGRVCGIALPAGLRESDRLPAPIFTPATKAETGHDINIASRERGGARRDAMLRRLCER